MSASLSPHRFQPPGGRGLCQVPGCNESAHNRRAHAWFDPHTFEPNCFNAEMCAKHGPHGWGCNEPADHPIHQETAMTDEPPTPKIGDTVDVAYRGVIEDVEVSGGAVMVQTRLGSWRVPSHYCTVVPPAPQPGEVWDFEGLVGLVVKRPHFVDLDVVWSDGSTTLLRHCVGPMRRIVPADAIEGAPVTPEETYDEDTMFKVRDALLTVMPRTQVYGAITAMQNAGILFRERAAGDAQ